MDKKITLTKIELKPLLEQFALLFDAGVDYVDITLNEETNIVHVGYKKEYLADTTPKQGGEFTNQISLN